MMKQIREAKSFSMLVDALAAADIARFSVRTVAAVARKLDTLVQPGADAKVALVGTHTLDPLPDFLRTAALIAGHAIDSWQAPYGQYVQAVTSSVDELSRFDPDLVLLSAEMRSLAPRVVSDFSSLTQEDADAERRRLLDHLAEWGRLACAATRARVLISNFPRPLHTVHGIADQKRTPSEVDFYQSLNQDLAAAFRSSDRVALFDLESAVAACGAERAWAHRLYYLAKQPWQPELTAIVARELWRHLCAAKGWSRKCLVLDLDNTLWGGVVGEEGPHGIRIGAGDPEGEAFAEFQHAVRQLKARGVLLAVASKNNLEDAEAAFDQRPEMPLRKDDFALMEIGWHPKAESIANIAATLDIGLDSLVFLDDNPAERVMVRGRLPDVLVPDLPADPTEWATFLRQQAWFERTRITVEDVAKTRQYREQAQRAVLRSSAESLSRYLADLGTGMKVWRARAEDIARAQQLFTKTNQFNLTTRRYGLGEVEAFVASDDTHELWVASASDRFGDLGIIGLYLIRRMGDDVDLDSFLLSCRALGRGIETALMNVLKQRVLALRQRGPGMLQARFIPTRKNAPAQGFLESQGFVAVATGADGTIEFKQYIDQMATVPVPHVGVTWLTTRD